MNFVKSFLFLSFILGLPISAKMVFETQVLEVTVPPDQYDVIGEFPFKIEGCLLYTSPSPRDRG